MHLTQYWQDPCGQTSIPWWKQQRMTIPDTIKILHHREFSGELAAGCRDQVYFRLLHTLDSIPCFYAAGVRMISGSVRDAALITDIINRSYRDIRMTEARVREMAESPAYCPSLWILAQECATGQIAGCIIGEFHAPSGEMSIEWLQVLPQFRRGGIGSALVTELLRCAPVGTRFVTVSGQVENDTNPEGLYRRCGFTGNDYWHILFKEN